MRLVHLRYDVLRIYSGVSRMDTITAWLNIDSGEVAQLFKLQRLEAARGGGRNHRLVGKPQLKQQHITYQYTGIIRLVAKPQPKLQYIRNTSKYSVLIPVSVCLSSLSGWSPEPKKVTFGNSC